MDLLCVSEENNFRFYSTAVKFPLLTVCVRETTEIIVLMDQMSGD